MKKKEEIERAVAVTRKKVDKEGGRRSSEGFFLTGPHLTEIRTSKKIRSYNKN